jgi:hypothetical protein
MPIGVNVPDENLVPGWNSQGNFALASTVGTPGQGYATSGAVPASANLSASLQASSGLPQPPGALNIGAENSGSQGVPVLTNPGYADGNTLMTVSATSPNVTTAGVQQPFGVSANAAIITPTGITAIAVAPFTLGTPSYTNVWTGTSVAAAAVTVTVPPAGFVKTVGANATSVTYTPTF